LTDGTHLTLKSMRRIGDEMFLVFKRGRRLT
jgi:hypothetical protein